MCPKVKGTRAMKLFFLTIVTLSLTAGTALADGDAVKGEQIYKKCMACHSVTDATNKVGPHLVGVVDRKVAIVEGFNFPTMK